MGMRVRRSGSPSPMRPSEDKAMRRLALTEGAVAPDDHAVLLEQARALSLAPNVDADPRLKAPNVA